MDIKRASSKTLHRLERAGKACGRGWNERAEDGRIRYAIAGLGLGLMVGSLLSAVANSLGLINWESFGPAPITFLGCVVGLFLFGVALMPESWTEKSWAWERRKLSQKVLDRASDDPEFWEDLKADPRRAIEREFRVTIRDGYEITVLEERPEHAYIVLPVQRSELLREQADAAPEVQTESNPSMSQGTGQ
jgi:hypothetical protein